jgi:tRNA dimethylallyltransferase
LALEEIAAAHTAGKVPLVVGGTGLYLRALIEGLAEVPEVPAAVRDAAEARHRELGGPGLHAELVVRDPAMAARLEPGDSQRLIRAWEVLEATGRSLAEWQAEGAPEGEGAGKGEGGGYRFLRLVRLPPRAALYAACDARFRAMIERGALEELRELRKLRFDPRLPVMRALGVRELGRHLDGAESLDSAVVQAQQATRNYAKRQMTWLRTQAPPESVRTVILGEQHSKSIDPKIFANIRRFLLTP